jgi:sugar O-acyltransferase (sialic acid O-acetyltransferase NeuD family)
MTPIKATIFILGSSGFAHELADYIEAPFKNATQGRFGLRADSDIFYVDDSNPDVLSVKEYRNKVSSISGPYYSIMGSGKCSIKVKMLEEIVGPIFSYTHPRAVSLGKISEGCVVAPGAVLAPRSVLGKHVLCNYNATVGHDSTIGDYSVISPNASVGGYCTIGEGVYIGSNACIRENISIGKGAVIGMNATITKDVPPNVTIINTNERLYNNGRTLGN